MAIPDLHPQVSILTPDPPTTHRLNACAYQQSALTTVAHTQYAAFYTPTPDPTTRFLTLARRDLSDQSSEWHHLTFTDYPQRTDDGHNTISVGICAGDGTIHLAFDHHCDTLHYRLSQPGLAYDTRKTSWTSASFGAVQSHLPGCSTLSDVTYPRFIPAGENLFFECRIGRAGAGSEALYLYTPAPNTTSTDTRTDTSPLPNPGSATATGKYTPHPTPQALYLHGQACNPYPNGLSFHAPTNKLHITWTNRHFVPYEGAGDPTSTAHKAQTGPNGPENNEGLYHAFAEVDPNPNPDPWHADRKLGVSVRWRGSHTADEVLATGAFGADPPDEAEEEATTPLDSQDPRLRVRRIPRGSGIMNQESQFVDADGTLHVLNRENTRAGREEWVYYVCGRDGKGWESWALEGVWPTETGLRGKVVCWRSRVWFVLPENEREEWVLARWGREEGLEVVWRGNGFTGEPVVDERALLEVGVLSVLGLRVDGEGGREVVVLTFVLEGLN
ncbi:uncharacterized protein BO66DRAFT_439787 [Aspergillus aculeatinus CBS 121060]|uniref:Uncharacterized protein n=1 Tax=Aspergillus aculeatinus CBS 121060 TaxID=1448322 RepID=A0ACD1H573_9EURO|nr:hypothetical protein BO66DRAFT_439787 [Aspergillus aculeatinus CBS 121060]RAH68776.1 hypothetical protein BO66DRAFT_439787 [Aspergillus aculeatinus CBS 121060]